MSVQLDPHDMDGTSPADARGIQTDQTARLKSFCCQVPECRQKPYHNRKDLKQHMSSKHPDCNLSGTPRASLTALMFSVIAPSVQVAISASVPMAAVNLSSSTSSNGTSQSVPVSTSPMSSSPEHPSRTTAADHRLPQQQSVGGVSGTILGSSLRPPSTICFSILTTHINVTHAGSFLISDVHSNRSSII